MLKLMENYIKILKEDIKKINFELEELQKKITDLNVKKSKLYAELEDKIFNEIKIGTWYENKPCESIAYYFRPLRKSDNNSFIGTFLTFEKDGEEGEFMSVSWEFEINTVKGFENAVPNEIVENLINKYAKKIYGE